MQNNYDNLNNYYTQKFPIFSSISAPILQSTPLKSFAYQRLYLGGNHFIFFTNKDYSQCFFETVHELCSGIHNIVTNLSHNETRYLLWNEKNIKEILSNLLRYNIAQGLTVYKRTEDYVDCYYFAGDKDSQNLNNFYINNINKLMEFIDSFNTLSNDIVTNDTKVLGKHTGEFILTDFKNKMILDSHKLESSIQEKLSRILELKLHLSKRELECLKALAMGYSMKFIANKLGLSPRTVECYLQAIKQKTQMNYKDQLVNWFHNNMRIQ